jgi:hypothetical protein
MSSEFIGLLFAVACERGIGGNASWGLHAASIDACAGVNYPIASELRRFVSRDGTTRLWHRWLIASSRKMEWWGAEVFEHRGGDGNTYTMPHDINDFEDHSLLRLLGERSGPVRAQSGVLSKKELVARLCLPRLRRERRLSSQRLIMWDSSGCKRLFNYIPCSGLRKDQV